MFCNCYDYSHLIRPDLTGMNESTPQQKIQYLVEKFHREEATGAIAQYNESETKNGFIEFMSCMG